MAARIKSSTTPEPADTGEDGTAAQYACGMIVNAQHSLEDGISEFQGEKHFTNTGAQH